MHVSFSSFTRDMAVSASAAAVAKTTVAPIERVKLLLQLQSTSTQIRPENQYRGLIDCLVRIPKEQGFFSYWRGNTTNVGRYLLTQGFNFAFKDAYALYFNPRKGDFPSFGRVLVGHVASGGAAGITSMMLTYPLDFARTRLTTDVGTGSKRQFAGLFNCIGTIYKKEGLTGIYRGLTVSIPTVMVYRASYFGLYDTAKETVPMLKESLFLTWLAAQTSTTAAGLLCYPLDTIRRRLVMQSGRAVQDRDYTNFRHCVRTIYTTEGGFTAFYKGSLTNVFRGMGGALVLVLYDEIKKVV